MDISLTGTNSGVKYLVFGMRPNPEVGRIDSEVPKALGLELQLIDDERVADLMGLNVRAFQVAAFTRGAGFAGIGGGLFAHHFSYVEAQYFGFSLSISIVLYVLFGGTQSVLGPLLGAGVFTLLPELLRGSAQWRYVLFAAIVILVMVVRPQGLVTGTQMQRLLGGKREPERTKQPA